MNHLCAGDTHLWLDGLPVCSCGRKWQRLYRMRGAWGELLLVLTGDRGRRSVGRGVAWGLDWLVHITHIIGTERR